MVHQQQSRCFDWGVVGGGLDVVEVSGWSKDGDSGPEDRDNPAW